MGRFDITGSPAVTLEIPRFLGMNTANSFSEIDMTQSPNMVNAIPGKIGSLGKRPGTIPITNSPLSTPIKTLCNLRINKENNILAAAGTKLYKYNNGVLTEQTMTSPLNTDEIDYAQFKDANGQEVLVIADGGKLKEYNGSEVKEIVPAPNEDGYPDNDLANINANHSPIGCLVHNTRVVIWDGSDTIWHSKVGYYDYFGKTDFQRFVRENDYVVACVTYAGALMVLMRRHIGVLFGDSYTPEGSAGDWSQDFLDTTDGCINAKTVQMVTFPSGKQEVFYLSDDGVSSIYTIDTIALDSSARYSTRSITRNLIDWDSLGVTNEEWRRATSRFYNGLYWLIYPKGNEWHGLVFNTDDEQWYPVKNVNALSFYHDEDHLYFSDTNGHIKIFDSDLYSDWDDKNKSSGTPIMFEWYSKLATPELTGLDHMWDILMIEAKQWPKTSSLDVEVNTYKGRYSKPSAIKTATFIWGVTAWGEAQYDNQFLTDAINNAKRLRTFLKGQYAQIHLYNNRDEPIEIYSIKYEIRVMKGV